MSKDEILKRERLCFDFLNSLNDLKYVLVGGYAVSSFNLPRFSVDLDIVIPETEMVSIKTLLESKGFSKTEQLSGFDNVYSGRFERYSVLTALPVSVDLLVNSIRSRQTNFSYSFDYLFNNSELREVRGLGQTIKSQNIVADREMLLALKINSMRTTDQRDIIVLCYDLPDVEKVFKHIKNCNREIILSHLSEISKTLTNPKNKDSIKGVFSIDDKTLNQLFNNCKKTVDRLTDMLK